MQILHTDSELSHVFGQIFCHSLGQSRDQNFVMCSGLLIYLPDQIIDLPLYRPDRDLRIQKSGRTNDLLRSKQFVFLFINIRSCRYKQHLINLTLKLFKVKWSVIQCRRQAEAVIDQCGLSGTVSGIHAPHLRNRDMGLIHNDQIIIWEEIHQCIRSCPRRSPCKMSRIVLNSTAKTGLLHHFHIKVRSLGDSLCFDQLIFALEICDSLLEFLFDILACL